MYLKILKLFQKKQRKRKREKEKEKRKSPQGKNKIPLLLYTEFARLFKVQSRTTPYSVKEHFHHQYNVCFDKILQ